jgi:hypothetical protein
MLWLQTPPWGRWLVATLIAGVALWVELGPDPLLDHPFAVQTIKAGERVDESNTEMRQVPSGLLGPVPRHEVAARDIAEDAPILASDVAPPGSLVPLGWWSVSVEVPPGATRGETVRLVMLDTGMVVDGVVATPAAADALGSTGGAVAVHPDQAGEVAAAAVDGRVAVLISTG